MTNATSEYLSQQLDTALAEYTPGIDRAVRFLTIDQVDMLAEFYLHNQTPTPDPRDAKIARLVALVREHCTDRHDDDCKSIRWISGPCTCGVDDLQAALAALETP